MFKLVFEGVVKLLKLVVADSIMDHRILIVFATGCNGCPFVDHQEKLQATYHVTLLPTNMSDVSIWFWLMPNWCLIK